MSRYTRPPNTSLFVRNVADATRMGVSNSGVLLKLLQKMTPIERQLLWLSDLGVIILKTVGEQQLLEELQDSAYRKLKLEPLVW
ncbi:hypothetical protein STEG23_022263 [Scotinomys teguina]